MSIISFLTDNDANRNMLNETILRTLSDCYATNRHITKWRQTQLTYT